MHLGLPPLRRSSDFSTSNLLITLLFVYVQGLSLIFQLLAFLKNQLECTYCCCLVHLLRLVLRAIEEILNGFNCSYHMVCGIRRYPRREKNL